jgi:hypothetical protein
VTGFAYFEWSVDGKADEVDLDDRELWALANPSLGVVRANGTGLSEEYVAGVERGAMTAEEFARERLGIIPDLDADERWSVLSQAAWAACEWLGTRPETPAAIAFDMPPDRSSGAIGCAAHDGGFGYVDVLDHGDGTGWMVDRLVDLKERFPRAVFCCDAIGPASSLLDPLKKAGVKRVKTMTTREHQQACGGLYDAVVGSPASPGREAVPPTLRHRGRPELDAAVAGAEKRTVGDAWLWSRKDSSVDISPLVTVTLALMQGRQKRTLNPDNYR